MRLRLLLQGIILVLIALVPWTVQESLGFIGRVGTRSYFNYVYLTQHGSEGFFGPYNSDNRPLAGINEGDFASFNGWFGSGFVSGSEAGKNTVSLSTKGSVKFSDAVKASGVYSAWSASPGEAATITGRWALWELVLNTPLAQISYGRRFFAKGAGLQFGGGRNNEYFVMKWGGDLDLPYKYGFIKYEEDQAVVLRGEIKGIQDKIKALYDKIEMMADPDDTLELKKAVQTQKKKLADKEEQLAMMTSGWPTNRWTNDSPIFTMCLGFMPWRRATTQYYNQYDLNGIYSANLLGFVELTSTYFQLQLGTIYSLSHRGPESQDLQANRSNVAGVDIDVNEGWLYGMYQNGRLYFKNELDWYYSTTRHFGSASDYVESWRYMAEAGIMFGPAEVRVLYSYMPGPDRRRGVLVNKQPFILDAEHSATEVFDGFSKLIASSYSGGITQGIGDVGDASVLAARFNYLLAANLGIHANLLYAERVSHGWGWGAIRPNTATSTGAHGTVTYGGIHNNGAPSIPARDIGWEVNCGFSWQLLDALKLVFSYAYWQPGKWFSYAYVDKSKENWDVPNSGNIWGANPSRRISPVSIVQIQLVHQ
jgi:hypothetical protein